MLLLLLLFHDIQKNKVKVKVKVGNNQQRHPTLGTQFSPGVQHWNFPGK